MKKTRIAYLQVWLVSTTTTKQDDKIYQYTHCNNKNVHVSKYFHMCTCTHTHYAPCNNLCTGKNMMYTHIHEKMYTCKITGTVGMHTKSIFESKKWLCHRPDVFAYVLVIKKRWTSKLINNFIQKFANTDRIFMTVIKIKKHQNVKFPHICWYM